MTPGTTTASRPAASRLARVVWPFAVAAAVLLSSCSGGDNEQAKTLALDLSRYEAAGVFRFSSAAELPQSVAAMTAEASAVAYNADSNSLLLVGEGEFLVEVDRRGAVLSYMALRGFRDTEGLTYLGEGRFLIAEERDQRIFALTYVAGAEAERSRLPAWKLGPAAGNSGLEGISYNAGSQRTFAVKEKSDPAAFEFEMLAAPEVRVTARFAEGCTERAVRCWDLDDLADVAVLSGVHALRGTDAAGNLLVLSQTSAKLIEVDRRGRILGEFDLGFFSREAEGVTVDPAGTIYIVAESHFAPDDPSRPIPTSAMLVLVARGRVSF